MQEIGETLRGRLRDNLLARLGIREEESVRAFLDRLRQESPGAAHEVVRVIIDSLCEGDGTEGLRQFLKEEAERQLGWQPRTAYERYTEARRRGEWGPDEALHASGLPDQVNEVGFESFKARRRYPSVQEALEAARAWTDDPHSPPLLTLAGSPGTGKTHLALAAAWILLRRPRYVVYRTEGRLLAEVRQSFDSPRGEDPLGTFRDCPWLILDDLGVEAATGWAKGIIDQVVDHRWAMRKRLLMTTNAMSPDDLPPRLASRLSDVAVSRVVAIDAPDYRRRRR